jgi:hypothetical protein
VVGDLFNSFVRRQNACGCPHTFVSLSKRPYMEEHL